MKRRPQAKRRQDAGVTKYRDCEDAGLKARRYEGKGARLDGSLGGADKTKERV
jgi:hypothetical protein